MRILFDNGVPRGLASFLVKHAIEESRSRGWEELANGALIQAAEQAGFDLTVTTDKNIQYQQNLSSKKIAMAVLGSSQWPRVRVAGPQIASVIDSIKPGSYVEIEIT